MFAFRTGVHYTKRKHIANLPGENGVIMDPLSIAETSPQAASANCPHNQPINQWGPFINMTLKTYIKCRVRQNKIKHDRLKQHLKEELKMVRN